MFILDINKSLKKIIASYIFITIFTVIFDRIYSRFSHGVSSISMNFMFLFPLLGGVIFYLLVSLFLGKFNYENFRFTFNIYNSGIAIVTVCSLLNGILEIAGTSSPYLSFFNISGWSLILIGVFITLYKSISNI